jgi:hypothetical protein
MRMRSLLSLVPSSGESVLDVGARDGRLASLLTERFARTVALDLVRPSVDNPRVECVAGNATSLPYGDAEFETVVCTEVLEHIPRPALEMACKEIFRVARRTIVIGVPDRQDLRFGETRCASCRRLNPPYGHVNRFDEVVLQSLFDKARLDGLDRVGKHREFTNAISTRLMRFAGNPYGTYDQQESCVYCASALRRPRHRTLAQKVATRIAVMLEQAQQALATPRANWLHAKFEKPAATV